jgi:hypothetical protein
MEVKALGRLRKLLEGIDSGSSGDDEQLALTGQLEQLVAPGASPYGEVIRMGRSFVLNDTTAVAAVVALPSTAIGFCIYNAEPDGGRSYVIDWVAAQNVVSTAVVAQAQIIANLGQVREAIPTNSAMVPKKLNGLGPGYDTRVMSVLTTALPAGTGITANWFPLGMSSQKPGAAATPGYGCFAPVDGRIIVPPGRYFAVHVLANVVGETFVHWIAWHERQLTLG